MVTAPSAL